MAVFLTKLDPAGKIVWQKFADGDGIDGGNAVATFGSNVVYVAGFFSKTIQFERTKLYAATSKEMRGYSPSDGFVARFDAKGNLVWVRQFGGPALDQAYGVASDKQGNVYIVGSFQGKTTFGMLNLESKTQPRHNSDPDEKDWHYGDMFVAKYDLQGNLVWVRQAGDYGLNEARAICVDAGGNAYVSGVSGSDRITFGNITVGSAGERWQHPCFLAKYDPKGNVMWAQSVAGNDYYHRYDKIAVDNSSNLLVSGTFSFTQRVATVTLDASVGDLFLAKYHPDGTLAWCEQHGSKIQDTCDALAVDADGRCFVAGGFEETAKFGTAKIHAAPHPEGVTGFASFLVAYSREGSVLSAQTVPKSGEAMAAGTNGDIWLMASFVGPVAFGNTTLTTKTDFWGERISDTFVACYHCGSRNERHVE